MYDVEITDSCPLQLFSWHCSWHSATCIPAIVVDWQWRSGGVPHPLDNWYTWWPSPFHCAKMRVKQISSPVQVAGSFTSSWSQQSGLPTLNSQLIKPLFKLVYTYTVSFVESIPRMGTLVTCQSLCSGDKRQNTAQSLHLAVQFAPDDNFYLRSDRQCTSIRLWKMELFPLPITLVK